MKCHLVNPRRNLAVRNSVEIAWLAFVELLATDIASAAEVRQRAGGPRHSPRVLGGADVGDRLAGAQRARFYQPHREG